MARRAAEPDAPGDFLGFPASSHLCVISVVSRGNPRRETEELETLRNKLARDALVHITSIGLESAKSRFGTTSPFVLEFHAGRAYRVSRADTALSCVYAVTDWRGRIKVPEHSHETH